jgi:CO dehydrogenase/acetyl-CoA synthase gamma subunit (corrinoid Fe-S protein)
VQRITSIRGSSSSYLASADLYSGKIDFLRYFSRSDCVACGFPSCEAFVKEIRAGKKKTADCPFLSGNKAYALEAIRKIEESWPEVPLLTHPRPGSVGLIELNKPTSESLVLITGNNEYTEQVLMTVLSTTVCPFFIIFINTEGNTVDMAMIYRTFTADGVADSLKETGIERKVSSREMIIPGLATPLKEEIERLTRWRVRAGPLCAAELPLFLSEIWIPPERMEKENS